MATTMLAPGAGGSYLESPTFSHTRTKMSPTGFDRRNTNLPRTALRFDISGLEADAETACRFSSKLDTPDSGFYCGASNTPLKTPESDISSSAATPPSGGSGSGHRKRKTVTIDESQTSIVVISPDDLFNTYSKLQVQSLESRDNPFLPGGELSREAEDLLSRATIIRDHFYLNEDEKRTLREHQQKQQQEQQEKQQRNAKHVHIMEHTDEEVASSDIEERHQPSPPSEAVEERISPQENSLAAAAPAPSHNGGDNHQLKTRENGKAKPATVPSENLKLVIPDGENQSRPAGPGDVQVQLSGPGELQVHEADKKRRNKCCSIM